MRKFYVLILTLLITLSIITVSFADSLLTETGGLSNMYGNRKACQEGDIVTILFKEKTVAVQSAKGTVKNNYTTGVGAGQGLLDFFGGGGMNGSENVDVESTTRQAHSLDTTLTARVEKVLPDGNLYIVGTRSIEVNHETQKLTVTGIVRPDDVSRSNTVESTRVGNMLAKVNGLPVQRSTKQRRGGVIRWVWGLLF